jgi:hypothetical protein
MVRSFFFPSPGGFGSMLHITSLEGAFTYYAAAALPRKERRVPAVGRHDWRRAATPAPAALSRTERGAAQSRVDHFKVLLQGRMS